MKHGNKGAIKATQTIPLRQLTKGKSIVILSYCGSAQPAYDLKILKF